MEKIREKRGFTIVELLTVMSIIVILISMLVPALNKVRRYALDVKERAQLHAIGTGLEVFNAELDGYPDSNEGDDMGMPYCGAMKLAEAMVGQDLRGFNPDSRFRRNGFPGILGADAPWDGMPYPPAGTIGVTVDAAGYADNLKKRKMYLQLENANATQIRDIWKLGDITPYNFEPNSFVLCDIYSRVTNIRTGKKIGMPILYYKADPTKTLHKYDAANLDKNIYDCRDNIKFIDLPLPWDTASYQPISELMLTSAGAGERFYQMTYNPNLPGSGSVDTRYPYRADSFILMSAGYDGEYGTGDDIFNFSK